MSIEEAVKLILSSIFAAASWDTRDRPDQNCRRGAERASYMLCYWRGAAATTERKARCGCGSLLDETGKCEFERWGAPAGKPPSQK